MLIFPTTVMYAKIVPIQNLKNNILKKNMNNVYTISDIKFTEEESKEVRYSQYNSMKMKDIFIFIHFYYLFLFPSKENEQKTVEWCFHLHRF